MQEPITPAERLPVDTIKTLSQAARKRYETATILHEMRPLAALYLYGYVAEMALAAAYFRIIGFQPHVPIDRDTRRRHMAEARQATALDKQPVMNNDPHPLPGWARFIKLKRWSVELSPAESHRLNEAINRAQDVYHDWRPELRYKTRVPSAESLRTVRNAVEWLLLNYEKL